MCDWIIAHITFCRWSVAKQNTLLYFGIQLLPLFIWHMNITNATRHFEMRHIRFLSSIHLFWYLIMHYYSRNPIHDIHYALHCFHPKMSRHFFLIQESSCNLYNAAIFPLYYAILLWCMSASSNAMRNQMINKLIRCIFSPSIRMDGHKMLSSLSFCHSTELLKLLQNSRLLPHEVHPSFSWIVIYEWNITFHFTCTFLGWHPNICICTSSNTLWGHFASHGNRLHVCLATWQEMHTHDDDVTLNFGTTVTTPE